MRHLRLLLNARRRIAIATAAAAFAVTAVGAVAYWHTAGSGSGSATAGTPQPVTVAAFTGGDAPSSSLQPGGTADVILRLSNPNAYAVTLTSVSGNGAISADPGHTGCTTTGVTFTNQSGLNISLPSGSTLVHLPGAASMSTSSSSGCQGAAFSIPVTLTVQK